MEDKLDHVKVEPSQNGLLHFVFKILILIITLAVMGLIAVVSYSNPMLLIIDVLILCIWYFHMLKEAISFSKKNAHILKTINIIIIVIVTIPFLLLTLAIILNDDFF